MNDPEGLIDEFFAENTDLPQEHLGFRVDVQINIFSELCLSVEIPPNASGLKIETVWKQMLQAWHSRINAFNAKRLGDKIPRKWPSALASWCERESLGDEYQGSYTDLTEDLNRSIMRDLETAFYSEEWFDKRHRELREIPDPLGTNALQRARDTMTLMNVSEHDQVIWIDQARARYRNGHPAFEIVDHGTSRRLNKPRLNGPVDKKAVIGFLQYHRPK